MFKKLLTIVLIFFSTYLISAERSSEWEHVRKAHLKSESCCVICGTMKSRQVHHEQPFQFRPDLELVDSNLITVCTSKYWGFNCHFSVCHGGNFKYENPWIREDILKVKIIGDPWYIKEHDSSELEDYLKMINKRCKVFNNLRKLHSKELTELSDRNYIKENGDQEYLDYINKLKDEVMSNM